MRVGQRALHNTPMHLSKASLPKHLLQDDLASWDLPLVYGELIAEWRPAKPYNSATLRSRYDGSLYARDQDSEVL